MLIKFNRTLERILYLDAITSISNIDIITSNEGCLSAIFTYSFSIDEVTWSDWDDKSTFLLKLDEVLSVTPALNIFIRILVQVIIDNSSTYSNAIYNEYSIDEIIIDGTQKGIASIEYFKDVNIVKQENTSSIYRPARNIEPAMHIRNQLAQAISDSLGYPAVYFKTEADESSKSITFRSYDVHNYVDKKDLNIVLSSSLDYNTDVSTFQMFTEYENLEIEITKQTFHKMFGDVLLPSAKDAIWIALFNRMYRVVSVKEDRNFMNTAVAYRFYLGKFMKDASVGDMGSDGSTDEIDNFLDYEAFDLASSMYAKDEVENATGNTDSFELTKPEFSNDYVSGDSKMIFANTNLLALDFEMLTSNKYMFSKNGYKIEATSQQPLVEYNLDTLKDASYTFTTWFEISGKSIESAVKIADITYDGNYEEQLYVNKSGMLQVHVNIDSGRYIALQGLPMSTNNKYCIVYSRNISTVTCTVYAYDKNTNIISQIQTALETSVQVPHDNKRTLKIHADSRLSISNIRLMHDSTAMHSNNKLITSDIIDAHKAVVVDNCETVAVSVKRSVY